MKAQEPADSPPPKSRKDLGLKFGYLYLIYVINLTAVAKVRGALFNRYDIVMFWEYDISGLNV